MRAIEINDYKIYELTKDASIPEFLGTKQQHRLKKKNQSISSRLEVIHDLSMPDISTKISLSPDGKYLFILGAYSPRVRCYELEQMSMKFERHVDDLPSKIAFIERDYSKFVILEGHKTLAFHGQGGIHKKVMCEDVVTDIIYSNFNDKIYVPGAKGHVTMLDCEGGKLYNKFITGANPSGINCAAYKDVIDLFFCGTKNGTVDGYDPRTGTKVYTIDVTQEPNPEDMKASYKPEIAKIAFKNPLMIGVGTDKGVVHLYDIRNNSKPWSTRDLDYRRPIVNILFHEDTVIGALGSVFKVWEPRENNEGQILASYETNKHLNDFFQYPDSGLFFAASNDPQCPTYFIPRIGDAPRWCQKLSNLVVNMEVENQSMYDTHTFVTIEELDELNLKHLIGTPNLRAYTHGYYINTNTYRQTKAALDQLATKDATQLTTDHRSLSLKPDEEEDQIPDPPMNVSIKALSVQNRFTSFFKSDEFVVDPSNREFERVILQTKFLEKKRQLKRTRKEKAFMEHKLAKNAASDDEDQEMEFDDESDSESD